ncbi:MAG: DUF4401 domain-containing protein [Rhodospirillaceae bacterium]
MSAPVKVLLDRYATDAPSLPPDTSTPWFLIGLASIGAILAGAALMMALVLLLEGADMTPEALGMVCGVIALGGGLVIGLMGKGLFLNQFSTTGAVAGQVLLAGSIFEYTDSAAAAVVVAWAVAGLAGTVLRDPLQQFLSAAVAMGATCAWVLDAETGVGLPLMMVCAVPLGLAALFTPPRRLDVRPAAYAVLIVPLVMFEPLVTTYPLQVMGALPYAAGAVWVLWPALITPARTAVAVACAVAFTGLAPGVMGALLLLAVAWRMGNRTVAGVGVIALLAFVVRYYFDVDVTLLTKSGLLVAGGVLTLGLWMVWRRMAT